MFIRGLFAEEKVWERAQENAIWLLRAMQHTEEDTEMVATMIEFAEGKKKDCARSFRTRFGDYLSQDFSKRW